MTVFDEVLPQAVAIRKRPAVRARREGRCSACADTGMRPVYLGCIDENGRDASFEAVAECSCGTLARQREAAQAKREAEEREIPTRYARLAKTLEEAASGFFESPGLARFVEIRAFWWEGDRDKFIAEQRRARADAARVAVDRQEKRQSA